MAWHVLHGDSVAVSGYRVAVPPRWFVEQDASDGDAQLWNTKTGKSAWFRSFPKPSNFTLAIWSDLVQKTNEKSMNDSESPIVGKRELSVAGERFICFEKDFEKKGTHLPSVECKSFWLCSLIFVLVIAVALWPVTAALLIISAGLAAWHALVAVV